MGDAHSDMIKEERWARAQQREQAEAEAKLHAEQLSRLNVLLRFLRKGDARSATKGAVKAKESLREFYLACNPVVTMTQEVFDTHFKWLVNHNKEAWAILLMPLYCHVLFEQFKKLSPFSGQTLGIALVNSYGSAYEVKLTIPKADAAKHLKTKAVGHNRLCVLSDKTMITVYD